jgi:hypothetical protein
MPGLSNDPEKRRRQLDALAAGRRALARAEQTRQGSSSSADAPAADGPGLPVHTYGAPPKPPKPPEPAALPLTPEQEAMTPDTPTRRRPRPIRDLLGGLRDGL